MNNLRKMKCEVCRVGAPMVTGDEKEKLSAQIPKWEIIFEDGIEKLSRSFKFQDFKEAMDFTVKVGKLAESEDHHPLIQLEWGKVHILWWSHKIKGLHQNDFIMAAKTDEIFNS